MKLRYFTHWKLSNFQLSKLKSGIKNATKLTLKISSNVVGDSNIENKLLHKLLLTNKQVFKPCKALPNNSWANIKLSATQSYKIQNSGGLLRPLLKTGFPFIKIILKPLAKIVLMSLGSTETATDAAVRKKMFGSDMRLSGLAKWTTLLNKFINILLGT